MRQLSRDLAHIGALAAKSSHQVTGDFSSLEGYEAFQADDSEDMGFRIVADQLSADGGELRATGGRREFVLQRLPDRIVQQPHHRRA